MGLSTCRISLGHFNYRAEQMPTGDYEAIEFSLALKPSLLPANSPQVHFN
jgi:hypothetical protein